MRKASLNSKGFGLVAVLLVVVVLAVIGGSGAYVYHKNHKAKTTTSTTNTSKSSSSTQNNTPTPVDPYVGWKSYTTKYDKLSFRYPAAWKLVDGSITSDTDVTPGQDSVTLTADDGLQVSIGTGGTEFDGGNPGVQVLSSTAITTLGGGHYLTFTSSGSAGTTGGAVITTTNALPSLSNLPASKNIKLSSSAVSGLPQPINLINLQYAATQGSDVHYPLSKFQQDSSFSDAKLIIESLAY